MDLMETNNNTSIKNETVLGLPSTGGSQICSGCNHLISDRFLLEVSGLSWHSKCLKCTACTLPLENDPICYLRNSQVFCKSDYQKLFGTKCSKCDRLISPTDWVRRAREQVYHLACFACDACKRQLSTGEEFALSEDKVLCKIHFQEIFDGGRSGSEGDSCDESSSSSSKSKTKRVRTTFTDEQLQVLQANFQIDSNPDGQDLERIAQITGLSKRVTQVWFQNSRARQKKHMAKAKKGSTHSSNSSSSPYNIGGGGGGLPNHPGGGSFEKTSAASQLSESDSSSASPLTMLYSFA